MWRDALLSPLLGEEEQEEGSDKEEVSVIEVVKEETKETKEEAEESIDFIRRTFQPGELCSKVKVMIALEEDADCRLEALKESDTKDTKDEYIKAMEREISERRKIIKLLGQGQKYYDSFYEEAEIVASAYSNFGKRIKSVAVGLAEQRGGASLVPSLTQSGGPEDGGLLGK